MSSSADSALRLHRFVVTPSAAANDLSADPVLVLSLSFGPSSALQLWVIDDEVKAEQLAIAFNRGKGTEASSTKILGGPGSPDDPSQWLSSRLTRRLGRPVLVGFNCARTGSDPKSLALVQKGILDEIERKPNQF